MSSKSRHVARLVVLFALGPLACQGGDALEDSGAGGTETGATGSSSSAGSSSAGAADSDTGAHVPTVILDGWITIWAGLGENDGRLPGAKVCPYEAPPDRCDTTDADGAFSIEVPASSDFGIDISAPDYLRTLILIRSGEDDLTGAMLSVIALAAAEEKFTAAGGSWPLAGTGIVETDAVLASQGFMPATGATMSIDPASGSGAVYTDENGYPDPALTSTSDSGGVMFVNVEAGEVTISGTHEGSECGVPPDVWPVVPVVPDALTYRSTRCP